MNRSELWAAYMCAALAGCLAAEREGFSYSHKSDAASSAAKTADYALQEHEKRFGPLPREA